MKIKRLTKNKYLFENGLTITLNNEIVNRFELKKREELSDKEYLDVLKLATLSTSYYYLTRRDYAKKELYLKLLQKYKNVEVVKKTIINLEKQNLLNDIEYTKQFLKNKKGSRLKLKYELTMKGIDRQIIENAFIKYKPQDELDDIKKYLDKMGNKDNKKKIASLIRRGFLYEDIKKVIDYNEEEEC